MVLVHDTSSYCALQLYEVSLKYLCWLSTYTERTQNSIANDQREITPKIQSRVMVLVHDTSSYCALQLYEVSLKYLYWLSTYTERTQNSIANDQREITPKIQSRVMVLVHDTSSYCALQLYEVSLKYL